MTSDYTNGVGWIFTEQIELLLISKYHLIKTDVVTPENYRIWETLDGEAILIPNMNPGEQFPRKHLEKIEILMNKIS